MYTTLQNAVLCMYYVAVMYNHLLVMWTGFSFV